MPPRVGPRHRPGFQPLFLSLLLAPPLFLAAAQSDPPALVPQAGVEAPAELGFEIRERGGDPIPARLTFVPPEGGTPFLFPNVGAAPHELAARDNVVYTRSGRGRITVPPGRYRLHVSRGLEWSLDSRDLELAAGEQREVRAELVHELDTPGWISADFHLHTLTYSGHGDANLEERVLSFMGEGLEFAVATDHNHNTDYHPTMRALGIEGAFGTCTGNEISTPIGHFNAFPLDPERPAVDATLRDANALFRLVRAEPNAFGVVPVIELNHPRLSGIDYFTRTGLDPVLASSDDPAYGRDYDAIEVLNENLGLGYHDPVSDAVDTHGHTHSALRDWFHLLNRGERYAAVGNSDSHQVRAIFAGYPRNFVRVSSDDPARVDPAEVADAVRTKRLFTTTGPFVELSVVGVPLGGEVRATDGHARLALRLRAASWVDCDRVLVFQNGDLVATLPVPETRDVVRLETELELCLQGVCARHGHERRASPSPFDAWVSVVVEGDDSLAPVLRPEAKPLALTNPVWIDGDGDGRWTSPLERIGAAVRAQPTPAIALDWFHELTPSEQMLAIAQAPRGPFAAVLIEAGFRSTQRDVLLAAARASEKLVLSGSLPEVLRLWREDTQDPFLDAILVRIIALARPEDGPASLVGYHARYGADVVRRYREELLPLFPEGDVRAWAVLGPVAEPSVEEGTARPPEPDARLAGRDGKAREWVALEPASPDGYVDLASLGGEDTDHCLVYAQTWLHTERARTVLCAFGSDDGSRVWLDGREVYSDPAPKQANPLETLLSLELHAGWNRLVLAIDNVTGGFGFYCRLLDPAVQAARAPR